MLVESFWQEVQRNAKRQTTVVFTRATHTRMSSRPNRQPNQTKRNEDEAKEEDLWLLYFYHGLVAICAPDSLYKMHSLSNSWLVCSSHGG